MNGLTFLNPWFLLGASAALVPLVVYLLQRHRAQRVVFGSVWFLRDLAKKIVRRRRSAELILLIVRMVLILLAALAFARPLLMRGSDGKSGFLAGGSRALAVVVDCSASMGVAGRHEQARQAALAAIEKLRPGDAVAVYAFAAHVTPACEWTTDRAGAKAAARGLRSGDEATNLAEAIRFANAQLAERPEPDKDILVVSDMQATGWQDFQGDWTVSKSVSLSFADMGGEKAPDNAAIVQVSVPQNAVLGASGETLSCRVQNFAAQEKELEVRLTLDGKPSGNSKVRVPPGSSQVVAMPAVFTKAGEIPGVFSIEAADDFPADNQAHFVMTVQPKIQTIVVSGAPGRHGRLDQASGERQSDGGYYLMTALAPSAESVFQAKQVAAQTWSADDLDGVAIVTVTDADNLKPEAVRNLKAFLARGGGLVFFPGRHCDPARFNALFADVVPCHLEKLADVTSENQDSAGLSLTDMNYQHPALRLFALPHHGDFSTVHFKQYYRLTDTQAATVLGRLENGRPAIVIKKIGKGSSLLVAGAPDLAMNDFPLRGVFVPFLQEAARHLASAGATRLAEVNVGADVQVDLPAGAASATLERPDGGKTDLAVISRPEKDGQAQPPAAGFVPKTRGLHKVILPDGKEILFAANSDPRESDLRKVKSEEIAAALTNQRGSAERGGAVLRVEAQKSQREEREKAQRWGWLLLATAGVLLLTEMFVADRVIIRD